MTEQGQLAVFAQEWRNGWRPGLAAMVGGSISYSLYAAVSSLFIEPLQAQFGWSRSEIAFGFSFGLITAFAAPVFGRLTDRIGVRPVLLAGLMLTGLGYVLLSAMHGTLAYYYCVYLAFSFCGLATTGITFTRILSGAFDRARGKALALGRASLAVSGALMPLALFPVITRYGTAGGYLLLAGLVLFVALPLIWLWVPDDVVRAGRIVRAKMEPPARLFELLAMPKLWILGAAAVFNYVPVVALMSQMKPLAVSKGLDAAMAVGALSAMGIAAAAGALLSGALVDRFWAPGVAFVLNCMPAIGCLFLLGDAVSTGQFYGAVILLGLGQGAEIDIVAFMIARYFGLRDYATIYGLTTLGIALGVALGASLIGWSFDIFGNYDLALTAGSASFALAAVCYLAMGRYPGSAKVELRPVQSGGKLS